MWAYAAIDMDPDGMELSLSDFHAWDWNVTRHAELSRGHPFHLSVTLPSYGAFLSVWKSPLLTFIIVRMYLIVLELYWIS